MEKFVATARASIHHIADKRGMCDFLYIDGVILSDFRPAVDSFHKKDTSQFGDARLDHAAVSCSHFSCIITY